MALRPCSLRTVLLCPASLNTRFYKISFKEKDISIKKYLKTVSLLGIDVTFSKVFSEILAHCSLATRGKNGSGTQVSFGKTESQNMLTSTMGIKFATVFWCQEHEYLPRFC